MDIRISLQSVAEMMEMTREQRWKCTNHGYVGHAASLAEDPENVWNNEEMGKSTGTHSWLSEAGRSKNGKTPD